MIKYEEAGNTASPHNVRENNNRRKRKKNKNQKKQKFLPFYILRREAANFFTYKAQFLSWRAEEDAMRAVIEDIEEDMAKEGCDIIQFWHLLGVSCRKRQDESLLIITWNLFLLLKSWLHG